MAGLRDAFGEGRLELHGKLARYRSSAALERLLHEACRTEWVVYAKPPFDDPEHVLTYLARSTHRIAISNHRLLHVDDDAVTFRYKDHRSWRSRSLMLSLEEFTRRFLLHVLPKGFGPPHHDPVPAKPQSDEARECFLLLPQRPRLCPRCGPSPLRCVEVFARPPPLSPWPHGAA